MEKLKLPRKLKKALKNTIMRTARHSGWKSKELFIREVSNDPRFVGRHEKRDVISGLVITSFRLG